MRFVLRFLLLAGVLVTLGSGLDRAADHAPASPMAGTFQGRVYQVDTIYNFVDVIMPGGTKRFFADDSTRVHAHRKPAHLIDISMGEQVRGTYRTAPNGKKMAVTIDDLTEN